MTRATRLMPLALLVSVACARPEAPPPASVVPETAAPVAVPNAVAPVPTELPDVVARVNGEDIGRAELKRAVARLESQLGAPLPDEERSHVIRELLDQQIALALLLQEATARGIEATDADVDGELAFVQAQFPSEQAFTEALAQEAMTLDEFRTETARQIVVSRLIEDAVASQVTVTSDELTAFYEDNPNRFRQGAQVRASHILISVPQGADEAGRADARAQAEQLLAEVETGGNFAVLAQEHSDDPGSGAAGGDLGYFREGTMVPEFEQVAFALQPGETSGLVETQFGYHIIRVVDRQAPRMLPLDDVRTQLEQFLQGRNEQEATQQFINDLRTEGTVEILI